MVWGCGQISERVSGDGALRPSQADVWQTLYDFPDDTPNFSNVVGAFASKRCRAAISTAQRVAVCREDVEATGDTSLFDEAGYLVGLSGKHSILVTAEAVDGRACTGVHCAAIDDDTGMSKSQPMCGRRLVGSRLYCDLCHKHRVESGKAPSKPVRVALSLAAEDITSPADDVDGVSPLTSADFSSGPFGLVGSGVRWLRGVGAAMLFPGQCGSEARPGSPKSLELPEEQQHYLERGDTSTIDGWGGNTSYAGSSLNGRSGERREISSESGQVESETGSGIPTSEVPAEAAASDIAELKLDMRQMMDTDYSTSSRMGTVEREAALVAS